MSRSTTARPRSVKNAGTDDDASRRERILLTAVEQFADKGFAAVRIDEIAAAAGANKQLIYYYFNSKAVLYDAVLERMVTEMTAVWDSLDSAPSLEAALWRMQEWNEIGTTWRRLLAWEGLDYARREGDIHLEDARTRSWERWVDIIRHAQQRGELREDLDTQMFALTLIAVTGIPSTLPQVARMISGDEPDTKTFQERHADLVRALLQAMKPLS